MLPYIHFSELFPRAMLLLGPKIYSEFNITAQQFQALKEINTGPITVGDFSARLGLKLPAAARLLRRLDEKQWIMRTQDKSDRRVYWLQLTDEGRTFKNKLQFKREEVFKEMFYKLSADEQKIVVNGIELLLKALK